MMKSTAPSKFGAELNLMDMDMGAITDTGDKIAECQYFLDSASKELDVQRFRWQISAFLGAAYSFFEISALSAYNALTDPRTGESVKNVEAIKTLEHYVTVSQNDRNPSRIDTGAIHKKTKAAIHEVTKQLYEIRKRNTHHCPLSIMVIGAELPEAFHFCDIVENGTPTQVLCLPALAFCRDTMLLIRQVQKELEAR